MLVAFGRVPPALPPARLPSCLRVCLIPVRLWGKDDFRKRKDNLIQA